jgi:hypothetical protein
LNVKVKQNPKELIMRQKRHGMLQKTKRKKKREEVAVRHETHEEASAREKNDEERKREEKSSSLFALSLFALQFNLSQH